MTIEMKDINKVFHIQESCFIESCMFDEVRKRTIRCLRNFP